MERERLSSRLGFILLSAGCAIGLGNVWRFPYITGRYGGAAFVLIYLIFLLLIGLPVMTMEFAIGRAGRKNIAGALRTLEPKGTKWHVIGPAAVAGNYILLMFYSVLTGWLIYYFVSFLTGGISSSFTTADVASFFGALTADPLLQIVYMAIALLMTALLLFLSDRASNPRREKLPANNYRNGISYWQALAVGIGQAFAVIPGLSRSGTTISVGLICGVRRDVMAQFSFLMVLVPILGEAFLQLVGGEFTGSTLGVLPVLLGFVSAFLSGLFACKVMIAIVKKAKLTWFALYCAIVSLLIFIFG